MTHGTGQAILGLGDENDSNSFNTLGATQTELNDHAADTSTHGVAQVAGTADIVTHAALTTGVHGAGVSTLATAADIATHAGLDLAAAVHGFKGIRKALKDGVNEAVAVNEVKILTAGGGGLENDTFKLTIGGNSSAVITLPATGIAALTAAAIDTAMQGGTLGYADADVVVTGAAGGPWTLTFQGANAGTNIGNMTVTDVTEAGPAGFIAGPPTVTDDGTGASVQGVVDTTVLSVTGVAVGDILNEVVVYATKAAIATQVVRAIGDFVITGADEITVSANYAANSGNQYLFEWVDLT